MNPSKINDRNVAGGQNSHDEGECVNGNRRIFETPLSTQRYKWVEEYLIKHGGDIETVTDFGCGEGRMLNWLKTVPQLKSINFIDADYSVLDSDLNYRFSPLLTEILCGRKESVEALDIIVYHGNLLKTLDDRLAADCFLMIEVIEHLVEEDVEKVVDVIFDKYRPKMLIVTTPNREFNHLLRQKGESEEKFRHFDHKFEWNRKEFANWCQKICNQHPYSVSYDGVGHLDNSESFGPCTQIAIFRLKQGALERGAKTEVYGSSQEVKIVTQYKISGGDLNWQKDLPEVDWSSENCPEETLSDTSDLD